MKRCPALLVLLLCAVLLAAGGVAATSSSPVEKEAPRTVVQNIANDPPILRPYFGLLHAHTSYSDGEGTPAQAFTYARDSAGLDFLALTDHGELLSDAEWANTRSQAEVFTSTDSFAALAGFEWTDYLKGHICVLGSQDYASYLDWQTNTIGKFFTWLEQRSQALGSFAHPHQTDFNDFAFRSGASAQMALLEVANEEKNFELGFLTALSKGWKVGAVAAQDNHHPDWGDASGQISGIWAPSLTPSALLEAIRARRTFASDDRNLALSLKLNGAWMGNVLRGWPGQPLHWQVEATDPDPGESIVQADLLSLGGSVLATTTGSAANLVWNLETNNPGGNFWVFARVRQADGDLAYSSPVWLEAIEPPVLAVTPQVLTFTASWGESPAPQTLTLEITGESGVEWNAGAGEGWLTLSPSTGRTEGGSAALQVAANLKGLAPGLHEGTILISAPGATGSPKEVSVRLELSSPPLQSFDLSLKPGWNQVSLPLVTNPSPMVVFGGLPAPLLLFQYDPFNRVYFGINQVALKPGVGYWLKAALVSPITATLTGYPGEVEAWSMDFPVGWNMAGVPIPYDLPLSSLQVRANGSLFAWGDAVSLGLIASPPLWFDGTAYQPCEPVMEPGKGYWWRALQPLQLVFPSP